MAITVQGAHIPDKSRVNVLDSRNTSTSSQDRVAVYGQSTPTDNWGIGGFFKGGYKGVKGYATMYGTGSRYGGYFKAGVGTRD